MNYAICNETFEGWSHERTCAFVAGLGYTGLEVAPFTLAPRIGDVSTLRRAELRRQAEREGVQILGLHWLLAKTEGFHLTTADAATRRRTANYLAELAHACAELGGTILVLGSPLQRNIPDGLSRAEATANACDTLSMCLNALAAAGVQLCLEPLGPVETNFLNTAAEAVALVNDLAHPNLRLHLDVKAMSTEAVPIPELIRTNAAYLGHFHANDPNRRGPGFGDVPFRPIFDALREIQYAGWVSVEVFDYSPDPETIARESMRTMRACSSPPG